MPQHLEKEQAHFIKKSKCFKCKKKVIILLMIVLKKKELHLFQRVLVKTVRVKEKSSFLKSGGVGLIVSLQCITENIFYEKSLTIESILCNKTKNTTRVNIYATRFSFIDEKSIEIICQNLKIKPQLLIKPKPI